MKLLQQPCKLLDTLNPKPKPLPTPTVPIINKVRIIYRVVKTEPRFWDFGKSGCLEGLVLLRDTYTPAVSSEAMS